MHGFSRRELAEVQLDLAGWGLAGVQLVSEMEIEGLFLQNKRHYLVSLDFIERSEEEGLGLKSYARGDGKE